MCEIMAFGRLFLYIRIFCNILDTNIIFEYNISEDNRILYIAMRRTARPHVGVPVKFDFVR